MTHHEHTFLADFQPVGFTTSIYGLIVGAAFNWATIFGLAYVVGKGISLGLGL